MEFNIETTYDMPAMKALARGLRKTLRAKRSRRAHILGAIVIILGVVLLISRGRFDMQSAVTSAAVISIVYVFLREDYLNGRTAQKRGIPGLDSAVTNFREDYYHSVTPLGETTFSYDSIIALAETKDYFLFMFSPNHGQVYDKSRLTGGTVEEFSLFIERKTKQTFQRV